MRCIVCEKEVQVTTLTGRKIYAAPWESPQYLLEGGGEVEIHCHYGSIHDQCATYPFLAVICDDCIDKKKHLMDTQEEKVNQVWKEREEASKQLNKGQINGK